MKEYYVMTLFPEMIRNAAAESITGRAQKAELIRITPVNIRDYTLDRHGHVDDAPYGGGAGMLMQVQPVYDCYRALCQETGHRPRVLFMSPQGRTFDQQLAQELSREEELVFLCGHYEGIDERALELMEVEHVSIGDFILTGGELPALCMIDAISRLVPGVLNKEESHEIESFSDGLLEFPQYSRPEEYQGLRVPEVLLSGHHKNIQDWRHQQSLERTRLQRPELYQQYVETHPEEFQPKKPRRSARHRKDWMPEESLEKAPPEPAPMESVPVEPAPMEPVPVEPAPMEPATQAPDPWSSGDNIPRE